MKNKRKPFLIVTACLWTALIGWLLTQPESNISFSLMIHFRGMDKISHFIVFAFMTYLWVRAINGTPKTTFFIVIVIIGFGGLTEYLQLSSLGRTASIFDQIANIFGIMVGAKIAAIKIKKQT